MRLLLSGAAMAALLIWVNGQWPDWGAWTAWERISRLSVLIVTAALVFVGVLFGSGFRRRQLG